MIAMVKIIKNRICIYKLGKIGHLAAVEVHIDINYRCCRVVVDRLYQGDRQRYTN